MDFTSTIIPTIMAPLAGAIIGILFSRFGLPGKLKWQEYYLKRIELIEKILSLEPSILAKVQPQGLDCSPLYQELGDIITKIRLMSVDMYEQSLLDFDKLPFYKRIWRLPAPQSTGGTWATVLFYLYALAGLNVLLMKLLQHTVQPDISLNIGLVLYSFGLSLAVAVIARYAAIRSARAAVILERAKRQLVINHPHKAHTKCATDTPQGSVAP